MQRFADWIPYKIEKDEESLFHRISYVVCCAACGRRLAIGGIEYKDGQLRVDCSYDPNWQRNAVGTLRRSKRMPRRKFGFTTPDGDQLYMNLQKYTPISDTPISDTPERALTPFVMECDGKLLLDGRYVSCKEHNIVDPITASVIARREVLLTA